MRSLTLAVVLGSAALALTAAASARVLPAAGLLGETYYVCGSGFAYQQASATSGAGGVRCHKEGATHSADLVACANVTLPGVNLQAGVFPKTDYAGSTDHCAGTNPLTGAVSIERACPSGYSKRVQPGVDLCYKRDPDVNVAPSVAVSR